MYENIIYTSIGKYSKNMVFDDGVLVFDGCSGICIVGIFQ